MGKYLRAGTDSCWDFTPDDSDTEMYLESDYGYTLAELIEKAKEKWPEATLEKLKITSEYIHTHALYYDRYDAGDYTKYIKLELV